MVWFDPASVHGVAIKAGMTAGVIWLAHQLDEELGFWMLSGLAAGQGYVVLTNEEGP